MVDGIYFYEAQPTGRDSSRETSQNMVGKYAGLIPVSAETKTATAFTFGEETASLIVYDASKEVEKTDDKVIQVGDSFYLPLAGATFDLYAKDPNNTEDSYILVKEDLVSDENGKVEVNGLPDGYDYFFKQTKAPEGFALPETGFFVKADSDPIGNDKTPEPEKPNNDQTVPTNPGYTPSTPNYTFVTINVVWTGDEPADRPSEVKVQLLRDGKAFGDPVALTPETDWSHTWDDLYSFYDYTIEAETEDGYTATLTQDGNVFTLIIAADIPDDIPIDTPEQGEENKEEATKDKESAAGEEEAPASGNDAAGEDHPENAGDASDEDAMGDYSAGIPKTDDTSGFMFWFAVCFVSAIGVAVTARKNKEMN